MQKGTRSDLVQKILYSATSLFDLDFRWDFRRPRVINLSTDNCII